LFVYHPSKWISYSLYLLLACMHATKENDVLIMMIVLIYDCNADNLHKAHIRYRHFTFQLRSVTGPAAFTTVFTAVQVLKPLQYLHVDL